MIRLIFVVKLGLVITIGALLGILLAMDIITIIEQQSIYQTQIKYLESNKFIGESGVVLTMYFSNIQKERKIFNIGDFCVCNLKKTSDQKFSEECKLMQLSYTLDPTDHARFYSVSTQVPLIFYEVPGNLSHSNYLQIRCNHVNDSGNFSSI